MTHIMLVGNPNCGKTTLFNALTGDNQRVGNWPGVTVEKKTGSFIFAETVINITDLPGIYSLVSSQQGTSQDEQIAAQAIAFSDADIIINIVDACHLERHLFLTSQLLELGKPVILALNMMDIATQRGITIDAPALATLLNCPVIKIQAHKHMGISDLQQAITAHPRNALRLNLTFPPKVKQVFVDVEQQLQPSYGAPNQAAYLACRVLEGDTLLVNPEQLLTIQETLQSVPDVDVIMADVRYQAIHNIVEKVQRKCSDANEHFTAKLDRIVLHRFWALPIFFSIMYLMFLFAINIGGAFQDFFDLSTDAIFVQGGAWLLQQIHVPNWLIVIFADGVGKGINTTITFIPVIAAMFFILSLLEASGYMARAAFVVDKMMRLLGLPGKSFVPMIVGFGCNVPAILAARTLDSDRDRLLTVLMSPFMSCSARLTIYAVFVAAFFPTGGQNIVFSLYFIGILMAVLTGLLLRKTILQGQASPLILELPPYHKPSLRRLLRDTALRLRHFVWRAGKFILPVCVILSGLNAISLDGQLITTTNNSLSLLSLIGLWITPIFSPMGLYADNWPAAVGLLTGMLSKEVVVGSLNTLYAEMGNVIQPVTSSGFDLWGLLQTALSTIPENLKHLGSAFLNPILASAPKGEVSQAVYGVMVRYFDGQIGAYAYLLFILLYIPCVSTIAVIKQEASKQWMWFAVIWSCIVAYTTAVLFYQLATFLRHPEQSMFWTAGIIVFMCMTFFLLRKSVGNWGARYVASNS